MACPELFGVVNDNGKFCMKTPPQSASPDWFGTARELGTDGWNDFEHLLFHPGSTLNGVVNDKFFKGPTPRGSLATDWINKAPLSVGNVGWKGFQFLFFDPEGKTVSRLQR